MNSTNDFEQIDIKRMIEIVMERIVSIIIITIVCGLVAFSGSKYFITPKYQSYITMYINNQRNSSDGNDYEGKTLSSDIAASQQLVSTYVEMIKSNNVLQAVSDSFNQKTGKDYNIGKIKEMINTEAVKTTEILKVKVEDSDPAIACEIANIIANIAPEKIQSFIEKSDVRIVDSAKISTVPVSPNIKANTLLGALLGMVLSIAVILLRELFDVRVKSVDDLVNRFQHPVLGTIPEIFVSYDENSTDLDDNNESEN